MVAVEIAASQLPAQRVVQPQFAAGLAQALDPGAAQAEAAEAVEQAAHGDAPAAGIQQGDEKQFGAMPVFHQVQLQLDAPLRRLDGQQHAREEPHAVIEQGEAVVAAPGKDRAAHREVKISTAPTGTESPILPAPASLRRVSMPGARSKSAASSTSGDRVTTWKRCSSRRVTNRSLA